MSDPKNTPQHRPTALRWRDRPRLVDDGKPPRPRGRHAKPSDSDDAAPVDDEARKAGAVPVHQRLGFRPAEFAALLGVSYPTIWRGIKSGKIDVVDQNGIKIIPRAYAVKVGLISD
jgi:hypothetical protein